VTAPASGQRQHVRRGGGCTLEVAHRSQAEAGRQLEPRWRSEPVAGGCRQGFPFGGLLGHHGRERGGDTCIDSPARAGTHAGVRMPATIRIQLDREVMVETCHVKLTCAEGSGLGLGIPARRAERARQRLPLSRDGVSSPDGYNVLAASGEPIPHPHHEPDAQLPRRIGICCPMIIKQIVCFRRILTSNLN
jgi:hypothetical protein